MCLAIPGKVIQEFESSGMRMAKIQFGGIVREASLDYTPDAHAGDYVLVHVGFAISKVDAEEAERTYRALEALGAIEDELAQVDDETLSLLSAAEPGKNEIHR